VIDGLCLGYVDPASRHMDLDLYTRFPMVFGEDYLRVLGTVGDLATLSTSSSRARADRRRSPYDAQ